MKPSVFVLGIGGFIGRKIAARLEADGYRVAPGGHGPARKFSSPEDFADIVASHDWVIHAATSSTPASSAGTPLHELDENLRATLSLVEALQGRRDCGLIYLSSAGTLYGESADGAVHEGSTIEPRSYHGAAKVATEHFLRALSAQFGNRIVVVRPSNVYGPGQHPRPGFGIIPTAFVRCLEGRPLTIWGDGSNVRDYLYVDDLADLVARILASDCIRPYSVVNAAAGKGCSLMDLIEMVEAVSGKYLQRDFQAARSTDAVRVVPDPSLAFELYGWKPRTELPEGLAKTFDWIRRHSPPHPGPAGKA